MTNKDVSVHGIWASRWIFILAATGSAVGLGNIWKFPYIVGAHGGGAFVLVYLVCIALIGLPVMLAETLLGRRGRQSPVNTLKSLAAQSGASSKWSWAAMLGMTGALLILSFYSVVAGWAFDYILVMGSPDFGVMTPASAGERFQTLLSNPWRLTLWHSVFIMLTAWTIARGVNAGLERSLRIMMPLLFVLLLVLLGFSMTSGHFQEGLDFLFSFDIAKVPDGILAAMGHAFFTLSVGVGSIMAFGAYMPKKTSITKAVVTVGIIDTVVALTAGMALFPIVFAAGLDPSEGPGLMFISLPYAFSQIAMGQVFGFIFFVLVGVAAWSSSISMLEPAVAYAVERTGRSRGLVTTYIALACWVVGLGTVLSFNVLADARFFVTDDAGWHFFAWTDTGGKTFFDSVDYLTSRIMLPLGGFFFVLFAGWVLGRDVVMAELGMGKSRLFPVVYSLVRYVAPVGIMIIFITELFK